VFFTLENIISTLGFPIAISVILLIYFYKAIQTTNEALRNLTRVIEKLNDVIESNNDLLKMYIIKGGDKEHESFKSNR